MFVRIPIYPGESIGLECCTDTTTPADVLVPGGTTDMWEPALAPDDVPRVPEHFALPHMPNINATLESDVDGDGRGDETQDADDDGDGVDDGADGCPLVAAAGGCPAPAPRVNQPPTVRFLMPTAASSAGTAQRIDLEVSDDAGAPRVTVHDDDGTICTLTAAPYSCIWTPTGADVGRATLLASAVDSDGRSTLGIVRVTVPRFTATITRKRSGRRVTGALRLPAAVERTLGCKGTVTVRRGKAKRTAALKPNCTYSVRLPKKSSGAVRARFGGNPVVLPA